MLFNASYRFTGIHDRFLRDHVFRERMIQHNRDEDFCRKWCDLAEQDFTYRMSESEYFHYRQNWWISLNRSGNTGPLRNRSDFKQALSTLNRLHRESGGQQLRPMPYWNYQQLQSSSSSSPTWWQWSGSWWCSKEFTECEERRGKQRLVIDRATRCLQIFGENLRRMAFTNLLYFVADRSFTADGSLLKPTECKDNTSKTCFRGWTGRMSLSVLPSIRRTQSTIAPCIVVIGIGYRETGTVSMCGLTAPKEEDQWENDIAPRKGLVPHSVHAFLQELSYLRMILKSDGWTLITALETNVQAKGTVDNHNFQTQLVP